MNPIEKKFMCYFFGTTNCTLEVMAHSPEQAAILAAAQRIKNGQHYDFDWIQGEDNKMYRPHFILNDAKHSETKD